MAKKLMALMALTILTACDYIARTDARNERADRLYREAMDDYRAGRMDAAVSGFEKAVRNDPSNASARFQLACLQQDQRKDFLSAFCGYREFILQQPESDRAKLARERLAICEKEIAKALARKYGLSEVGTLTTELETVRAELKAAKDRVAAAEKNLGGSQERVRALSAERDRLLAAIKGASDEPPSGNDMQAILKEKDLLEEESAGEAEAGSSLIPVQKPEELARADVRQKEESKPEKKGPERPKTYVVEDGDTLYGIAKRFYGSIQPWKMIREANKALISADNRLRAGDTLVLP